MKFEIYCMLMIILLLNPLHTIFLLYLKAKLLLKLFVTGKRGYRTQKTQQYRSFQNKRHCHNHRKSCVQLVRIKYTQPFKSDYKIKINKITVNNPQLAVSSSVHLGGVSVNITP